MNRSSIAGLIEAVSENFAALARGRYPDAIGDAIDCIAAAFERGNKLLVFGNGGSASDAQHICGELVGRFLMERRGLPAIALTENSAVLTAWANDYDFESAFSRQIEALGAPGDVAWGISTSGTSANVVRAIRTARAAGLRTIGMTGETGGRLANCCDVLLNAPARETARIQEMHLLSYHIICAGVEQRLAAREHTPIPCSAAAR